MTHMKTTTLIVSITAATLGLIASASAQTINWGTTASSSIAGNKHFYSDGTGFDASLLARIGYFDNTFNVGDSSTWVSSFHEVGSDAFSLPSPILGYNFNQNTTQADAAANSKQAYVFVYNDSSLLGTPDGEALIYTNPSWILPTAGGVGFTDMYASAASQVLFGQLDTNGSTAGGLLTGSGVFATQQAADTFHVQTGSWNAAAVPEPSASLLGLSLGLLALRRRRNA